MSGPMIITVSGRFVNPLNLAPDDICEEDISHHLSCINRFNGATLKPITVAQHAVYVSRLLDGTGLEWQGLHHDDSEAYLGDVTKWVKSTPAMEAFREAEERAQRACYTHFGVEPSTYEGYSNLMHPLVEAADKLMLRLEGTHGFPKGVWKRWIDEVIAVRGYTHLTVEELERIGAWKPWSWRAAKEAFQVRLRTLRASGRDRPNGSPEPV